MTISLEQAQCSRIPVSASPTFSQHGRICYSADEFPVATNAVADTGTVQSSVSSTTDDDAASANARDATSTFL